MNKNSDSPRDQKHEGQQNKCTQECLLALALSFADDVQIVTLFEAICEIEKFLHLLEQTDSGPVKSWPEIQATVKSIKNMVATEFFRRTNI